MKTQADKIQQNNNRSVANESAQVHNNDKPSLTGSGPGAVAQRQLQEMIQNSPQAMQLKALQQMADERTPANSLPQTSSPVIQAKKSAPFDMARKHAARLQLNYPEYKDLRGAEYQAYVYGKLQETYNEKLGKGRGYWTMLQQAITKYKAPDNGAFLEQQAVKREDFNKRFLANYDTRIKGTNDPQKIGIGSSGLAPERKDLDLDRKEVVPDKKEGEPGGKEVASSKDVPYSNSVNLTDNSIDVAHVYAERDEARVSDEKNKNVEGYEKRGLPLSEILWQQYQLAYQKHAEENKQEKKPVKELDILKWRQVQTPDTLRTILFALQDGKNDLTGAESWAPGSEEFLAMLGTATCSSAAHLLSDHIDQLGERNITEIQLSGGTDVNIDIRLTRKPEPLVSGPAKAGIGLGAVAGLAAYGLGSIALGPAALIGAATGAAVYVGAKALGY